MKTEKTKTNPQVSVVREFKAPPEKVFDAWLDPEKISQWMFGPDIRDEEIVRLATDPRKGGEFSFVVRRQGEEIDHLGTYLEINRPHRLVFTWGIGNESEGESVVTIEIIPTEKGCRLTLIHEMDPKWKAYIDRTEAGWSFMLTKLMEIMNRKDNSAACVETQMLIRKPVAEVFEAFINPEVTKHFWFTKGSGQLEAGKTLTWEWEMYGVSTQVMVKEIIPNRKITISWDEPATTVDFEFEPITENSTYVVIKNYGFHLTGDELIQAIKDNTGGFTTVLDGLKAYLEHNIHLNFSPK